MVSVTINGKKKNREFQNMAQALAYAYQNGECYAAEKVELAVKETKKSEPAEAPEVPAEIAEPAEDATAKAAK